MRSARTTLKSLLTAAIATAAVLAFHAAAWAQEPSLGPLPGQPLDQPPPPLWLTLIAIAVALGALGLVVLIGGSYLFLSRRFFSKEEPPPPRRPAIRIPPGAGVPPPARAMGHPVSETAPQGAGATGTEVSRGGTTTATAERAAAETAEKPAAEEGAAAEKPAAEEGAAAEKPAAEEGAAAEKPAEEKPAQEKPAPARHSGPAELDQETFDRVLQEQLDKGTSPKVAEGRAKAAAVKAAREKAGAG
jgi:hypothetical protein